MEPTCFQVGSAARSVAEQSIPATHFGSTFTSLSFHLFRKSTDMFNEMIQMVVRDQYSSVAVERRMQIRPERRRFADNVALAFAFYLSADDWKHFEEVEEPIGERPAVKYEWLFRQFLGALRESVDYQLIQKDGRRKELECAHFQVAGNKWMQGILCEAKESKGGQEFVKEKQD